MIRPYTSQSEASALIVSHPAVLPVNQLPYAALAGRGWCVHLITPARWRHEYAAESFASSPLPELAARFAPLHVLFRGLPQRHLYLANPIAAIYRRHPAVVFCEEEPLSVPSAQWGLAAHALGVPFGVQMDENVNRMLPRPARAIRSAVLTRAAFVVARSETAAALARRWGATGQVRVIPHHVPGWPLPTRSSNETFTIGFAGRLVPEKGLDTLVAAVRRLTFPVELLVAGDGPLRRWLGSADLGLARLRIMPGTDHAEMAGLYSQMDVLVLPSRTTRHWSEQFGRVLVEALSCGTPVVGSSSGEIPRMIEGTGGGLIFPEGDESALADRLSHLRRDDSLRQSLAQKGRSKVIETFSVGNVADRLEAALRAGITSRRRTRA